MTNPAVLRFSPGPRPSVVTAGGIPFARKPALTLLLLTLLLAVAAQAQALRSYTVVLDAPSAGRRLPPRIRANRVELRQQKADLETLGRQVEASQQSVRTAIQAEGIEVVSSARHTINALFVRATREQADRIRQFSGVARVVRSPRFRLYLNEAAKTVGAPLAWNGLGGVNGAGAGLRIAIVDSGIDPTHPALTDNSLQPPAGFPKGRPDDLAFTSGKVIVARSYVHLLSSDDPAFSRPDDRTPRDRVGHGTSVATIAAGRQVTSPIGTITGIAPKAYLGNYKIFGSPGINEFTDSSAVIAAIDDAVLDGMDIISISFGAVAQFPWDEQGGACSTEPSVICDPVAVAAQSAFEDFGVVVVASAGNAGAFGEQFFPALNSIATPASAPGVIAVGSTVNSRQLLQQVRFLEQTVIALSGTGPKLSARLRAFGRDAGRVGDSFGCDPFNPGAFTGRIAVIERGDCGFEWKIENADNAGAVGVIITNVKDEEEPFTMVGVETTDIPAFMVGFSDGARIRAAARDSRTLELDPAFVVRTTPFDQIAPFSSRGPTPDNLIKPDIVAPGTFIYSAAQRFDPNGDTFDKSGYSVVDGTSFSAPMVAGAAALVWQARPGFSASQVRSALINSSWPKLNDSGQTASILSMGAGLLDIPEALKVSATAAPATVSFGNVGSATFPVRRTLQVANATNARRTYTVTVEPFVTSPSARVLVQGQTSVQFEVARNQAGVVNVTLTGSRPQPGIYEGCLLIAADTGGAPLRVPYLFIVGDGVADNSFAISGTGVVGTVNEPHPELLTFRATDRYGQPLANRDTQFSVVLGGGSIFASDPRTDPFGIAAADVDMGSQAGPQDFQARVAGLTIPFLNEARWKPEIGAIVDPAAFDPNRRVAPGSIASLFGLDVSELIGEASTLPLPIALKHVSVSFEFPEERISRPAAIYYASPTQINLQVPWELAGFNFALVKVRIEDTVSQVFNLSLADYAPVIFERALGARRLIVATHADGSLITPESPAAPNETIVVYCTGLGPVDRVQKSGEPAPANPLAWARVLPEVIVAGRTAQLYFAGLTPGLVGLYQVNATLPGDLPSGDQTFLIRSNGIESNQVTIPIR